MSSINKKIIVLGRDSFRQTACFEWINRKLHELIEGKIGASQLTENEIGKLIDERIEKRVDYKLLDFAARRLTSIKDMLLKRIGISKSSIGWFSCLFFLFAYAYWVEPNWIEISRYSMKFAVSKPLKIAHLSDLHIRSIAYREHKILSILENEKPDVVLITGDSVAENGNYQAVGEFLETIRAPLGVWSVNGNWEHWRPSEMEQEMYRSAGIKFLNNSASMLVEGIWMVGIDDVLAGNPDLQKAVEHVPKGVITIGLFHSPSFFDQSDFEFDLVFSGHTHGGQVRLPFLAPLWLPEGSGRFVSGWYEKNKSKMYVSRGLGNSILDIRFQCRPELSIIEILKKD